MLTERIAKELAQAQKARDASRVSALRMLVAALQTEAIAARTQHLDDQAVQHVLRRLVKQRQESIEAFRKGNRQDLAEREAAERTILEQYLPPSLSPEELRRIVQEAMQAVGATSAQDLGRVMKQAMGQLAGRADGKAVQQLARELLGP